MKFSILQRRFALRLFGIVFVATHIPLIAALFAHMAFTGTMSMAGVLIVLGATLVATAVTIYAMAREIRPVLDIADALAVFSERQEVAPIPHRSGDEIGQLAASARFAVETADRLLKDAWDAAATDPLTGLANRRSALEQARGVIGALAVIDLDHFKAINDTLGHASGDRVLEAVAAIMRKHARSDDIVARWGGEEFAIILPGADLAEAHQVIERIRQSVSEAPLLPDRQVTLSAGVTGLTGGIEAALRRADALVYEAKERGRNRILSS